ncbi:hypothetical protein RUND412_000076 [Rhizina undulata]
MAPRRKHQRQPVASTLSGLKISNPFPLSLDPASLRSPQLFTEKPRKAPAIPSPASPYTPTTASPSPSLCNVSISRPAFASLASPAQSFESSSEKTSEGQLAASKSANNFSRRFLKSSTPSSSFHSPKLSGKLSSSTSRLQTPSSNSSPALLHSVPFPHTPYSLQSSRRSSFEEPAGNSPVLSLSQLDSPHVTRSLRHSRSASQLSAQRVPSPLLPPPVQRKRSIEIGPFEFEEVVEPGPPSPAHLDDRSPAVLDLDIYQFCQDHFELTLVPSNVSNEFVEYPGLDNEYLSEDYMMRGRTSPGFFLSNLHSSPARSVNTISQPPTPENNNLSKPSLSRKISTRLRGFLHPSRSSSTKSGKSSNPNSVESSPASAVVTHDAASRQINTQMLELEKLQSELDNQRARSPRGQQAITKIDSWNYNLPSQSCGNTHPHSHPHKGIDLPVGVPGGHPSYISIDATTVVTESSGNPGLCSRCSSFRFSLRERSPESPITPDGEYPFTRIPPEGQVVPQGGTMKSGNAVDGGECTFSGVVEEDGRCSEEVPVFLDERSEVGSIIVPSLSVHPTTPLTPSFVRPSMMASPPSSTSYPKSPVLEDPPEFLTARTAPPGPGSGYNIPKSPFDTGPKLLRSRTMSSRPSTASTSGTRTPLSPRSPALMRSRSTTPLIGKEAGRHETHLPNLSDEISVISLGGPAQSHRPGTAFSFVSEMPEEFYSNPSSPQSSNCPPSPNPFDMDRSLRRSNTAAPALGLHGSARSSAALRTPSWEPRSPASRPETSGQLSITIPEEASAYAPSIIPEIPSSAFLRPITPVERVIPRDGSISAISPEPVKVKELKRSKSMGLGLRRAFTRKKSTREIPPPPVPQVGEIGTPVQNVTQPLGLQTINGPSEVTITRWKSVRELRPKTAGAGEGSKPPPVPSLKDKPEGKIVAAPLTEEELAAISRMPGTIFLKTVDVEGGDAVSHRMKPKKGREEGAVKGGGGCGFCGRGPFPNMWVCEDLACGFVMCRVCANDKVRNGEAELF